MSKMFTTRIHEDSLTWRYSLNGYFEMDVMFGRKDEDPTYLWATSLTVELGEDDMTWEVHELTREVQWVATDYLEDAPLAEVMVKSRKVDQDDEFREALQRGFDYALKMEKP